MWQFTISAWKARGEDFVLGNRSDIRFENIYYLSIFIKYYLFLEDRLGNDEGNRTWRMEYWRGLSACRRASVCSSIPRDKQSSQLIMRLVIYLRAGLGISTSHHRRRCLPAVDTNALSKTIYRFVPGPGCARFVP